MMSPMSAEPSVLGSARSAETLYRAQGGQPPKERELIRDPAAPAGASSSSGSQQQQPARPSSGAAPFGDAKAIVSSSPTPHPLHLGCMTGYTSSTALLARLFQVFDSTHTLAGSPVQLIGMLVRGPRYLPSS